MSGWKEGFLYNRREFLDDEDLDCVRAYLEKSTWQDEDEPKANYDAGVFISEEGEGHFCTYGSDPAKVRAKATKIIEVLQGLVDAIDALPKAEGG